MGYSIRNKSCPRCGSRDLEVQCELSPHVSLVACLDCDHLFEVGEQRGKFRGKRHGGRYQSNGGFEGEGHDESW